MKTNVSQLKYFNALNLHITNVMNTWNFEFMWNVPNIHGQSMKVK